MYQETASWGVWRTVRAGLLPQAYLDSVRQVGGIPVLLPPVGEDGIADAADQVVAGLDALILTGGPDIDPSGYGKVPHLDTDTPRRDRDAWEYALLAAALREEMPVLAICRGMQLLNAALGGTLRQHLPDEPRFGDVHRPDLGRYAANRIDLDPAVPPGTYLGQHIIAWCHHHQGVESLGKGLVATGAASDGLVESVWMPKAKFVVGVQWHPEEDGKPELFRALIEAGREFSDTRI
jgi:gamma-glutamyl-gamma-aminobutyrate hydrolase PuuD